MREYYYLKLFHKNLKEKRGTIILKYALYYVHILIWVISFLFCIVYLNIYLYVADSDMVTNEVAAADLSSMHTAYDDY